MRCPKCGSENPEDSKFCLECGHGFESTCPTCHKALPVRAKFCNECGHDLRGKRDAPAIDFNAPRSYTPKHLAEKILTTRSSIEGERKLVTVLFADVAGYTAISERLDPEEVHQVMDGCFRILMDEIHKYEGTINQFTGDGVMALFGAPVAHEDHAQRACHAALAIQKAVESYSQKLKAEHGIDFKLRMGLNSGPVVVGSIGDDLRMDYTAIGDTTNLASRLEGLARPGTILFSGQTHRIVRDFFRFEPLGPVRVKGKAGEQEAYELVGTSAVETRIAAAAARGLSRFVGRRRELEALKSAFEKARSGAGQVVGVMGEAGVGKSRLLMEFKRQLPEGEHTYLEGRCLHYGGSMAYLPLLDILRSYFDIQEGDPESLIKKKVADKMLELDEQLKTAFPPFQELLSLTVEDEKYLQLDPGVKKLRTFEALRDLFVCESENTPLVLAIEDLHWIDRTSQEFLGYLIDWLPNTHILLVLLYRPEYTHPWGSKTLYSKIGVDQLSSGTSAELVQAILEGGDVAPELRALILSRAGGNPLFVEELTQSLLENGSIQRKDSRFILAAGAAEMAVPDSIQGIIAARMDRVEENLKRIMQVASVIGREFGFRILQTITGMKEELKFSLLNLQGLEFISEKRLFPELEYIFKHALIQEVAYNSLLHKRKRELHEKIGQAIEGLYPERLEEYCELLAHHYARSDNKDKAVDYLDRANRKAIRLNALEDAMVYFDEAIKLLDTMPETGENRRHRISLLLNQWSVFRLLFKDPDYYELLTRYEHVAVELDDPGLLGALYARIGECQWAFGDMEKSIQLATKAVELCKAAGNAEGTGFAYHTLQWSHLFKGNYEEAIALKMDALRQVEQPFNLRIYVWILDAVSFAYAGLGHWGQATEEAEEALRVAEEYGDNSLISFAAWSNSWVYLVKHDFDRAVKYGELAVEKAPTPADKMWAETVLAWVWCRAGEPLRGVEILGQTLPIMRSGVFRPSEIMVLVILGEGNWLAGEQERARETLEEGLELAERFNFRLYMGWARRLLGEIAMETDPAEAASHFEKSIAVLREIKAENELALAYAGYGRFHKQQGRIGQAREYLTKALEILDRLGTLIQPDKVRRELEELASC